MTDFKFINKIIHRVNKWKIQDLNTDLFGSKIYTFTILLDNFIYYLVF